MEYADSIEPSFRMDQGIQGYISGDLTYNTGVKYPMTPLNAPLVKKAHDNLIHIYGEQANKPVQRGKVLGEKHSTGTNAEPLGNRGGPSHLAAKSMNGPPQPSARRRGRGAGPPEPGVMLNMRTYVPGPAGLTPAPPSPILTR